jgi:iron(III) transport system permease protein
MSVVFVVGFMAYGTRAMNAAILQLHKDLEEAAYVSGAPRWRTVLRVFFPLMMPTFAGVWIWTMLHAVRIAGTPLMLYEGEENEVLAIRIWNMWDEGKVQQVGAIGTLLLIVLLTITVLIRLASFGRGAHVQEASAN